MNEPTTTPTTYDFSAIGGFPVKRLSVNIGFDQNMKPVQNIHIASETRRIIVMPGKFARIEVLVAGKTVVGEFALGPLGWEYERS